MSPTQLLHRYARARAESDKLFEIVAPAALYERPILERHRIVFYIGHLDAFEGNLFRDHGAGPRSPHSRFDQLFAFGIDPVGDGLPADTPQDWPSLTEVHRYVVRIREGLDEWLPGFLAHGNATDEYSAATLLEAAIEHRLMHLETLAYMLHQLPFDQKIRTPADAEIAETPTFRPSVVMVPSGNTRLGLGPASGLFGWDNEFEAHTISVPQFTIDKYKVTNGEYLAFMQAGGYDERELWEARDWDWKDHAQISQPAFWKRAGGHWRYRTMFEERPLPLEWPVYVSHAEATAYARWTGKRLPSEAEWQRAAYGDGSVGVQPRGNFDFERWDPVNVNDARQTPSPYGIVGTVGNGWEWTSTVFAPFPGFRAFPFYPGYSANFFDGMHYVMKGASSRTAACLTRPSFRNWFQSRYPYVYAGFRCVGE